MNLISRYRSSWFVTWIIITNLYFDKDICIFYFWIFMEIYYYFIVILFMFWLGLIEKKILKLTTGFGCIIHFSFSSTCHVPIGSNRDKVSIKAMVSLLIIGLLFLCRFLCYYKLLLVIIFISRISCYISILILSWILFSCLFRIRRRAQNALAIEAVEEGEQSYQGEVPSFYPIEEGVEVGVEQLQFRK